MEKAVLARYLAEGLSLERIGSLVDRHPTTVAYWLRKYGLAAVNHEANAPKGGLVAEALEPLVAKGYSVESIAEELGRGVSTVRYWLRKHGLATWQATRRREVRRAKAAGLATTRLRCRKHGVQRFVLERRGTYRCSRCRSENVAKRRRKTKETLVKEAGGRCAICGYRRYLGALQFHHLDPSTKKFALSMRGITRDIEMARAEANKCGLLCSNCHAEVEGGITPLRA